MMPALRLPTWLMAVLLALVTTAIYWPATRYGFVNYDDDLVVTANVHVQNGLTWENVKWAFCNPLNSIWHPLTVLSHMLDCQLYGLNPWGHHLTSVLLHAVNTALVFLLFRRLTGATWRSALVAGLFGWHPVHVESVAWVSERKDVLSTFFGLLALIYYVRYAQNKTSRNPQPSTLNCLLALVFFAFGLMSKPMLVTWPLVMLLLDWWPLQRVSSFKFSVSSAGTALPSIFNPLARRSGVETAQLSTLVLEKLPFFGLAVAASVVTFVVQKHSGAMQAVESLPLGARGGNALISYCRYLGKLFWPEDLAVFYPHPGYWPTGEVLLAGGLLLGITVLCIMVRRRYPFMLIGWLWYVGTLVPVIQLVQTGSHAMADRYTYIPSIGVLVLVIWGVYELTRRWRYQTKVLSVAGCAVVIVCLGMMRQQLGYWKDNEILFRHALEVTKNNYIAHNNLGATFVGKGRIAEAIGQFRETIQLKPNFPIAHNNLGNVFLKQGRLDEAISQLQEAIRLNPDYAQAYYNLGNTLFEQGRIDEAISQYQEAVRLKPDYAEAHNNLGTVLGKKGRIDEAISQYQEAIRSNPNYAESHYNLGVVLDMKGRTDEAISQFQETIRLVPDDAKAHNNLGAALYRKGQIDEAIGQFQQAIRLNPDFAEAHYGLGTVLGIKGQIDEAIRQFQEAIRLKPDFAEARSNLVRVLQIKNAPAVR